MGAMKSAQPGIFALGTTDHFYVELDLVPGVRPLDLVRALAALVGPDTTVRGVNVVVGVRPELWSALSPEHLAGGRLQRARRRCSHATRCRRLQHDAWLWIAGGARDVVFDAGLAALGTLSAVAFVEMELGGWLYRHDRDLTGFIDGTENPSQLEAYDVAVVGEGPGQGSSVVLVQQWHHQSSAFMQLPVEARERIIGRTLADSTELDEAVMPADSHVSRTTLERDGEELDIFRRNTAYGGVTDHGTLFVGLQQGAVPAGRDAAAHGGRGRRGARRPDPLHHAADRRLLRLSRGRGPAGRCCRRSSGADRAQSLHARVEEAPAQEPSAYGLRPLAVPPQRRARSSSRGSWRRSSWSASRSPGIFARRRLRQEVARRVRPVAVGAQPRSRRRCTTTSATTSPPASRSTTGLVRVGKTPGGGLIFAASADKKPAPPRSTCRRPSGGPATKFTLVAEEMTDAARPGVGAGRCRPAGPVPLAVPRLPRPGRLPRRQLPRPAARGDRLDAARTSYGTSGPGG